MADKKITELTELTALEQDDLFVVVDSPSSTPITKKITASSMFSNVTFITTGSAPEIAVMNGNLRANANTTAAVSQIAGGKFVVNATALSQNTGSQYGIYASSMLGELGANVKTEHAAAKFLLDVSNATGLIVNTYGMLVSVANTGARAAQPQAFIGFGEALSTTALSTKYLFDIGQNGLANVSANVHPVASANSNVSNFFGSCSSAATPTHKLRIRVNGADYFILLANTVNAAL